MNIGVLNSGGDSPGLNAVIEGVVGAASRRGWNVVGFYDGFEGLLSEEGNERFEWLTPVCCRGLRAKGGTILGTVNKGNFAIKVGVDQKGAIEPAVLEKTKATIRRLGLDALIVVGGDGSQSTALLLSEIGLPVVGVPKTIDNDLGATDVTFGFYSAVSHRLRIPGPPGNHRKRAPAHDGGGSDGAACGVDCPGRRHRRKRGCDPAAGNSLLH